MIPSQPFPSPSGRVENELPFPPFPAPYVVGAGGKGTIVVLRIGTLSPDGKGQPEWGDL